MMPHLRLGSMWFLLLINGILLSWLGLQFVQSWEGSSARESWNRPQAIPVADGMQPPPDHLPEGVHTVILERPLFWTSRRPVPASEPTLVNQGVAGLAHDIQVLGVVAHTEPGWLIYQDKSTQTIQRKRQGDYLGAWLIEWVGADSVRLRHQDGHEQTLNLPNPRLRDLLGY